jgi:hypothetical protein
MNIGTHIPTTWQGEWPTPFLRTSEEANPGINGKLHLEDAWDSDNAQVETYLALKSDAMKDNEIKKIQAMQGSTVAVSDQFGISRGNCLVLRVIAVANKSVLNSWEVSAVFQLVPDPTKLVPDGWKDQAL